MDIFKLLDELGKDKRTLILYALLNRIPIFILGEESEKVNELVNELTDLIKFRKELVYYTDFISNQEYEELIFNEYNDYNCSRVQVRCPTNVSNHLLNDFDNYDSMVIGIKRSTSKKDLKSFQGTINRRIKKHIDILLKYEKVEMYEEGIDKKTINLSIEENIFQKISEDTERSINKMKRVLSEELRKKQVEKGLEEALLDFELEKREIKKNILYKEIQNFFSGAKRAFFILLKLKLIDQMQLESKIGSRTLLETIDYTEVPIERILSFIKVEWREDLSNLIENNKLTLIGEKIQSFWG
jgi:hypothetical protein